MADVYPGGEPPKTSSMFGPQKLSTKPTTAAHSFGTAPRMPSNKLYITKAQVKKKTGMVSPGPLYNMGSSFGSQLGSKNETAPSYRFGTKSTIEETGLAKESRPGPGNYQTVGSVGRQIQSRRKNEPTWKFGSGSRWGNYKPKTGPNGVFKGEYSTPAASLPQLPAGYLGDAPSYSFFGKAQRGELGAGGGVGVKPSFVSSPGPGEYAVSKSMGGQILSHRETSGTFKFGSSKRDEGGKIYITHAHERSLIGKHSPAPNLYKAESSIGPQWTSKNSNARMTKFGTGDRFSEVKAKDTRSLPKTPGPGSYGV